MAKKAGKGAKSCKIPAKTGVKSEKVQVYEDFSPENGQGDAVKLVDRVTKGA